MPVATISDVRELTDISPSQKSDGLVAITLEYASRYIKERAGMTVNGTINREFIDLSNGRKRRYQLKFSPVLDTTEAAGGVPTNDPTKILVQTFDTFSDNTFRTVPPSDYDLNGVLGILQFKKDKVPPYGVEIYISYKHSLFLIRHLEVLWTAHTLYRTMTDCGEKSQMFKDDFEREFKMLVGEEHAFYTISNYENRQYNRGGLRF